MAADEKDDRGSELEEEPLPPLKLDSIGDVGRGLAQLANEVRALKCGTQRGHTVGFILATLAKLKADVRDSKHKREVSELHDLLVKKKPAEPRVQ